jgi:hypothetical protein
VTRLQLDDKVCIWPIASFRCDAEFDRYPGMAGLWVHGLNSDQVPQGFRLISVSVGSIF